MKLFTKKAVEPPTSAVAQDHVKDIAPSKIEDGPMPTHTIDPVLEKRVRRKLDIHLIPLVSALYLRSYPFSLKFAGFRLM